MSKRKEQALDEVGEQLKNEKRLIVRAIYADAMIFFAAVMSLFPLSEHFSRLTNVEQFLVIITMMGLPGGVLNGRITQLGEVEMKEAAREFHAKNRIQSKHA